MLVTPLFTAKKLRFHFWRFSRLSNTKFALWQLLLLLNNTHFVNVNNMVNRMM